MYTFGAKIKENETSVPFMYMLPYVSIWDFLIPGPKFRVRYHLSLNSYIHQFSVKIIFFITQEMDFKVKHPTQGPPMCLI